MTFKTASKSSLVVGVTATVGLTAISTSPPTTSTCTTGGPGGWAAAKSTNSIIGSGHPAGDFQDVMFAGEQETHCGLVSAVSIECDFGGQPCSGIYRVDLVE